MHLARYLVAALVMLACSGDPLRWSPVVYTTVPLQPRPAGRLGLPEFDGCAVSVAVTKSRGLSYAAWFVARPDSSVMLMVSRAKNNSPWSTPIVADSSDRGARGCGRPAVSIAADSASGYVHLAFFIEPVGGGGVFFAHSMDGGATWHAPVPIVYGGNPSRASVAAAGDRVVVAYEDPNSEQPIVGIALSKTMGHIFEKRVVATSESGRARQPVADVQGDSVRLWWSEYSADPSVSATRPRYRSGFWNY